MGLGGLEPEAPQGPETTEDGPKSHRRSTTDLTLIRRIKNYRNPDKKPSKSLTGRMICRSSHKTMSGSAGLESTVNRQ